MENYDTSAACMRIHAFMPSREENEACPSFHSLTHLLSFPFVRYSVAWAGAASTLPDVSDIRESKRKTRPYPVRLAIILNFILQDRRKEKQ